MPTNIQAALVYAQFQRIEELVHKKRWIWNGFRRRLEDVRNILLNLEPDNVFNGVCSTALVFGESHGINRDDALRELPKLGIPTRPFFTLFHLCRSTLEWKSMEENSTSSVIQPLNKGKIYHAHLI